MGEGWEKFPFPNSKRAKIAADRSPTWLVFSPVTLKMSPGAS